VEARVVMTAPAAKAWVMVRKVDGLETRRWNGTKSAFADCALGFAAVRRRPGRPLQRDRRIETMRREAR
jgi:hypothetical protein